MRRTVVSQTGNKSVCGELSADSDFGNLQRDPVRTANQHFIIFNEIKMGYRNNMGNERLGDEIAQVKCRVEPANEKWKSTKIHIRMNAAGEQEIAWVQVAGENVRHLL